MQYGVTQLLNRIQMSTSSPLDSYCHQLLPLLQHSVSTAVTFVVNRGNSFSMFYLEHFLMDIFIITLYFLYFLICITIMFNVPLSLYNRHSLFSNCSAASLYSSKQLCATHTSSLLAFSSLEIRNRLFFDFMNALFTFVFSFFTSNMYSSFYGIPSYLSASLILPFCNVYNVYAKLNDCYSSKTYCPKFISTSGYYYTITRGERKTLFQTLF